MHVATIYNAAADLIERNLAAGRALKTAFIDDHGSYTYADLAGRVSRFANVVRRLGIHPEQRILLCLHDTIDFPTSFLGAIKAGAVPVAVNTQLSAGQFAFMLADSRARAVIVSAPALPAIRQAVAELPRPGPEVIVSGAAAGERSLSELLARAPEAAGTAPTHPDEPCFWLYSSGSTGRPKGTVHIQSSLIHTAELYAIPVLGITESDIVFSAAKLFFAYGLGNALTFPMAVGATAVLSAERPSPPAVSRVLREHRPTIFCGVPTLYNAMLAGDDLPRGEELLLRRCVSAGEPLPPEIGRRWSARIGVDILDGIGSTEMLHIFLSNRPGEVRYGTTGKPIAGYAVKIVDEAGNPVKRGEIGDLFVAGPTSAAFYWNSRERCRTTFLGPWTRTGDKYFEDQDGYYVYCGRSDDMLKVSGMYVSPAEVEAALIAHEDILEAAVIGAPDADGLIKPKAYVVPKPGIAADEALARTLSDHAKSLLAPFKCPRWYEFVDDLPKTATGKIQRFRLREASAKQPAPTRP
ncbi:MAG: benzoate-CoA ligase family protein [Alphaproteobacteria bacterium]|nr:benzoate-CoA ligase family protein [Alphaproteobacteria bacterium]